MPDEPLRAHSLAEAHLYLLATPCPSCSRGPLKASDAHRSIEPTAQPETPPDTLQLTRVPITATCGACHVDTTCTFLIPQEVKGDRQDESAVVNPTDEPSRILDVGQWVMLFRVIVESADNEPDKIQTRHLGLEAAQCLEEALKFYDDSESDLPPPEAFFTDVSRARLREHPEQFSRQRLIELRAKLPSLPKMRSTLAKGRKRSWWRRGS